MFDLLADFGDSDEFLLPSSASGGVDLDQQLQLVPVESASQPPSEPLQRKPELGLCEAKAQYNAFYGSSLQGKCGKGRHGGQYERRFLMLHLRTIKMHRRANQALQCFEDVMKHVEKFSRFKKQCQVKLNRYTRRAKVCVVKRSLKGNQHKRSVPDLFFLYHCFLGHRFAICSKATYRNMKALIAMAVMSHQLKCLAKLGLLMRNHRAAVAVIQRKWDEASACFQVKLNTLPSAPHQSSTWSVMVYRASVRVFFEDGMKIVLHLVTLDSKLPQALWARRL